jgi:hypothetical protein
MMIIHPVEEDRLEVWLEAATYLLAAEPAERIREEVTDHYLLALDEARSSGKDEVAAHAAAHDSLGSPTVARKGYIKTYLTEQESGRLTRSYVAKLISLTLFYVLFFGGEPRWEAIAWLNAFAGLGFVFLVAAEVALRVRFDVPWLLLAAAGECMIWGAFWWHAPPIWGWFCGFMILLTVWPEVRLFHKLRYHRKLT